MSGGSYDYLYSRLDDENGLGLFLQALPKLLEDLNELRTKLLEGEVEAWSRVPGTAYGNAVPYPDARARADQVGDVLATFQPMAAEIVKIQEKLLTYRDLLYAVEWWQSGDTSAQHPADAVKKFVEEHLK